MEPLGIDLKRIREEKGITLKEIADATRISLRHMQNLESGHYKDLPGGIYNRAFLRAYCEHLGIDTEQILRRYAAETTPTAEKASKPDISVPQQKSRGGIHPTFLWSLMLALSVSGLYYSRGWIASVFSPYFREPAVQAIPTTLTETETEPQPIPTQPIQATETPALAFSTESAGSANAIAADAIGPTHEAALETAEYLQGSDNLSNIRLKFEVLQKCWISVHSDGHPVAVMLMEPGDKESFGASDRFFLILGNAGGVRLTINGRRAKPLGKSGEVVRVLINEQNIADYVEELSS